MASRQISLGVHAILVLHKVSYRPSPNPRAGGSNHNHLRGVALAQHNIYYRTLLRSAFQDRFQPVSKRFSWAVHKNLGSHKHSCTHKAHVKAKPRCTLALDSLDAICCFAAPEGLAAFRGTSSRFPFKSVCGTVPARWDPAVRRGTAGQDRPPGTARAVAVSGFHPMVLRKALTLCYEMRPHP